MITIFNSFKYIQASLKLDVKCLVILAHIY